MTTLPERYRIDHYIDTFALGHYARVLDATDLRDGRTVAFKVLRPEHLGMDKDGMPKWEYRAFALEIDLLVRLADLPQVVDFYDCGYLSAEGETPIGGEIISMGRDVRAFADALVDHAARRWRPYLTLAVLPRADNLFYQMRPDKAGLRLRLPTEEGLALALQFAELLRVAHGMGIVYLDHKLEHLYWDGSHLTIIDLNSSRLLDAQTREEGHAFTNDVHNLCVGILYSIFTGLSPQKTALRPQPGTLRDVESRYEGVSALDFGVEPSLSPALQLLLQRGAAKQIATIDDFITGLRAVASLHGWDFPGSYTSPDSRDVRAQTRAGIAKLRKGQALLRDARDLFREAAIQEGITDDLEAELRRLVKTVNEMLNHRAIP